MAASNTQFQSCLNSIPNIVKNHVMANVSIINVIKYSIL